jgi:hypothetical protein
MISFVLSIGFILHTGCGLDGEDIVVIRNLKYYGYETLEACDAAGKQTGRGYKCRRETK